MIESILAFLPPVRDHLFETTIFVVAMALLATALRRQPARLRHLVWLAASVKFLLPFSVLVILGASIDWSGRPVIEIPVTSDPGPIPPIPVPVPTMTSATISTLPAVLAAVWISGIVAVLAIWIRTRLQTRRILRTGRRTVAVPKSALGLADVRVSPSVSSPGVYGLLRPVLLLPEDIEGRLTPDELDAVVAHEIAHVRRRDNLTTAFHMIVTAVFWFHPFVWWIGRQLVNERERASDEAALGSGHSAEAYAEGLLKICRASVGLPAECVSGISSSNLKARVEGIMRHHKIRSRGRVASVAIGLVAIVVVAAPLIWGLSTPEFTFAAETRVAEPEERSRQEPAETVEPAVPVAGTGEAIAEGVSLVQWLEQEAQARITDEERRAFESLETDEERERFIEQFWLRREASPGGIWVEQEVPYIITAEEREAFESLGAEEERERFIEQFWLRRDPTPGTGANEFRDEHYRRIAYANENFGFEGTAGWRTDRGALYIIHGEPDSKEGRPDGGAHYLPPSEGGAQVMVYPFEQWRYRYIEGLGQEIVFEFVDAQATGNYRLALTPHTKIVGDPEGEAFTIFRALRGGAVDAN